MDDIEKIKRQIQKLEQTDFVEDDLDKGDVILIDSSSFSSIQKEKGDTKKIHKIEDLSSLKVSEIKEDIKKVDNDNKIVENTSKSDNNLIYYVIIMLLLVLIIAFLILLCV